MGGISKEQVLSLIGMTPLKNCKSFIAEKLKVSKSTSPRMDMIPMFSQLLGGNMGSLLQNPMAALTGQAQGLIGQLTSSIPAGMLGGALPGALSSLSSSLGNLSSAGNLLSGLSMPGDGQFGLIDAVMHSDLASQFGSALPVGLGMSTVLGPLQASTELQGVISSLSNNGLALPHAALNIADLITHAATMNGIVSNSTNAMATLQGAVSQFSTISVVAGAVQQSTDPQIQAYMQSIMQPSTAAAIPPAKAPPPIGA